MNKNIFDTIKNICKEKGITVSSLEKQAGLSKGSVYKWNTVSPSVESLSKVANVLKVSINKLIGN